MPIHVEEMTSEVTLFDGDLPLTEAQLERLVSLVLKRLKEIEREAQQNSDATSIRRGIAPRSPVRE